MTLDDCGSDFVLLWMTLDDFGLLWMTLVFMFLHPGADITPEEECMLVCSPSTYEFIDGRLCICNNDKL